MSERGHVAAEVADRFRRRGIPLPSKEKPDELGDLLSAVERFESAVESHGGDLMVDDLKSSRPDDRHFVLPPRAPRQAVRADLRRLRPATPGPRRPAPQPD